MLQNRFGVGVVGPGRVGSVLAAALAAHGVDVLGYTRNHSEPAPAMPADVPDLSLPDLVAARPAVYLLAVGDNALWDLARQLAAIVGTAGLADAPVAWHVSGRYGPEVLHPLSAAHVEVVAAAPAMTFTGEEADLRRLPGTTWALTAGSAPAAEAVTSLIGRLGGVCVTVAAGDRPRYHAALSMASNHLATLQRAAAELLLSVGLSDPAAVLRPLAEAALADAWPDLASGLHRFTGPVSRADAEAVAAHVRAIVHPHGDHTAQTLALYRALIRATTGQAVIAGALTADEAQPIVRALDVTPCGEEGPA